MWHFAIYLAQPNELYSMGLNQKIFNQIHNTQLIYNICWEDPDIDRALMQINSVSKIVMITSAGCNALCYLLDNPAHISCVDINPRQNAVLALKIALIEHTNFNTLFDFFGKGHHPSAKAIYQEKLRPNLSDGKYVAFWDKHIKHIEKGSYHYSGTSGKMAKWIIGRMRRKGVYESVLALLEETDPRKRTELFNYCYSLIFPKKIAGFVNSTFAMNMLGIPNSQKKLIESDEGSMYNYIYIKLAHTFTKLPIEDNYFWKFYIKGGLSRKDITPAYLQEKNFEKLRSLVGKISLHTGSIEQYLRSTKLQFSHFVLLDHQDWMAYNQPELLSSEWQAIFGKAEKNAAVLFRSAAKDRAFLPDFVQRDIAFKDDIARHLHAKDRVGTYGSTHFGVLNPKIIPL
jgi:S-adenosylmethionine-diacylglycerol 3-amino-3-carboxypropyl transferase